MSIKAISHSCSPLLFKIHMPGQDYCSGDCITLSPPLLSSGLVGSVVVLLKGVKFLKTRCLLWKLSISCAKHISFLLWPRSNRKCAKIIMAAKTKDYSLRHALVIRLRPACIQRKTHAVLRAAAYWLSYF